VVALKYCIRPMHYSGGLNLNFEPSRGHNFMSVSGLEFLEELRDHRNFNFICAINSRFRNCSMHRWRKSNLANNFILGGSRPTFLSRTRLNLPITDGSRSTALEIRLVVFRGWLQLQWQFEQFDGILSTHL